MMNRTVVFVMLLLAFVSSVTWFPIDAVDACTSEQIGPPLRSARCFQDTQLRESIATLKQQGGTDVEKVRESLLTKARTDYRCRIQVVQALISNMGEATDPKANQYQ